MFVVSSIQRLTVKFKFILHSTDPSACSTPVTNKNCPTLPHASLSSSNSIAPSIQVSVSVTCEVSNIKDRIAQSSISLDNSSTPNEITIARDRLLLIEKSCSSQIDICDSLERKPSILQGLCHSNNLVQDANNSYEKPENNSDATSFKGSTNVIPGVNNDARDILLPDSSCLSEDTLASQNTVYLPNHISYGSLLSVTSVSNNSTSSTSLSPAHLRGNSCSLVRGDALLTTGDFGQTSIGGISPAATVSTSLSQAVQTSTVTSAIESENNTAILLPQHTELGTYSLNHSNNQNNEATIIVPEVDRRKSSSIYNNDISNGTVYESSISDITSQLSPLSNENILRENATLSSLGSRTVNSTCFKSESPNSVPRQPLEKHGLPALNYAQIDISKSMRSYAALDGQPEIKRARLQTVAVNENNLTILPIVSINTMGNPVIQIPQTSPKQPFCYRNSLESSTHNSIFVGSPLPTLEVAPDSRVPHNIMFISGHSSNAKLPSVGNNEPHDVCTLNGTSSEMTMNGSSLTSLRVPLNILTFEKARNSLNGKVEPCKKTNLSLISSNRMGIESINVQEGLAPVRSSQITVSVSSHQSLHPSVVSCPEHAITSISTDLPHSHISHYPNTSSVSQHHIDTTDKSIKTSPHQQIHHKEPVSNLNPSIILPQEEGDDTSSEGSGESLVQPSSSTSATTLPVYCCKACNVSCPNIDLFYNHSCKMLDEHLDSEYVDDLKVS